MVGASLGEITACLVRVPVEIVKQRRQVRQGKMKIEPLKCLFLSVSLSVLKHL